MQNMLFRTVDRLPTFLTLGYKIEDSSQKWPRKHLDLYDHIAYPRMERIQ